MKPSPSRHQRRPTIVDVAQRAGVSKSLVSLVLRDPTSVGLENREAILAAMADLAYRPNAMARGLVRRRTGMLGVLLSDLSNPFFGELSAGLLRRARELDLAVVFNTGNRDPRSEEEAIGSLLELRADGLILAGPQVGEEALERAAAEVPVVVLNRPLETEACDCVTDDDEAGGRIAVEHLVGLGHRRIAHVDGGPGAGAGMRRRGFEAAMREHGLLAGMHVVEGSFTEQGGYDGARALLRTCAPGTLPTAIFAANDLAAIGVLSALEETGLRIPDDVSVMGYDNSFLASLRHVSLTSIDQDADGLGVIAVDRLVERLGGGRSHPVRVVTRPTLVPRSSTAPPRKESP
jgi:DNA-binding LacI/PurR family transcriptional regulator